MTEDVKEFRENMAAFLGAHADTLGNPAAYFVDFADRAMPLVVRHDTGTAEYVVQPDGSLKPFDPTEPLMGTRAIVENPPDFKGFPEHDRTDPKYDLAKYAKPLGNPADFFVHWESDRPLVVRHSTGMPAFIIGDGLVPFGE